MFCFFLHINSPVFVLHFKFATYCGSQCRRRARHVGIQGWKLHFQHPQSQSCIFSNHRKQEHQPVSLLLLKKANDSVWMVNIALKSRERCPCPVKK